jgi:3-dehydroquinate dehydratase-1
MPEKSSLLSGGAVVGSVSLPESIVGLAELASHDACDIVEVRADLYPDKIDELSRVLPQLRQPVLLTVRHPLEGGNPALSTAERTEIIRALLPFAALIDLELRSVGELVGLVREIRAVGKPLVVSFHDFERTPNVSRLQSIVAQAKAHGADVCKIAAAVHTPGDLANLVHLFSPAPLHLLSVMGMGQYGKVSRLLFATLGSVLNYGYLDAPTVAGQWPARRLKELVLELRA